MGEYTHLILEGSLSEYRHRVGGRHFCVAQGFDAVITLAEQRIRVEREFADDRLTNTPWNCGRAATIPDSSVTTTDGRL